MSTHTTLPIKPIRRARTCYDHLAGILGVEVTTGLMKKNLLELHGTEFKLTPRGEAWFANMGIDLNAEQQRQRKFAYACIDGTERKPHLAGALGAALCKALIKKQWIRRVPGGRALEITPQGELALNEQFRINLST